MIGELVVIASAHERETEKGREGKGRKRGKGERGELSGDTIITLTSTCNYLQLQLRLA
jgi:hypothetical protein